MAKKTRQVRTIGVADEPVSFKVPSEVLDTIRGVAAARGVSVSQLLRDVVSRDIELCPMCGHRTRARKDGKPVRAARPRAKKEAA
jgi:hypothetical protein